MLDGGAATPQPVSGRDTGRRRPAAMTNLVIDAPALVEVSTVDPDEIPALAERVCGAEWLSAPSLVDYEVLDVLRTLVARGDIDHELAASARQVFDDLRLIRYPLTDDAADRVWQLRHKCFRLRRCLRRAGRESRGPAGHRGAAVGRRCRRSDLGRDRELRRDLVSRAFPGS